MNLKHILLSCYFIALGIGVSYGVYAALKTPLTAFFAVKAGPLPNKKIAEAICPTLCSNLGGTWTGRWQKGEAGKTGFCFGIKDTGKPLMLSQQNLPLGLLTK